MPERASFPGIRPLFFDTVLQMRGVRDITAVEEAMLFAVVSTTDSGLVNAGDRSGPAMLGGALQLFGTLRRSLEVWSGPAGWEVPNPASF